MILPLSAIVITKNEEQMIADCLKSLQFARELIVVDTGNTDTTNDIARSLDATVVKSGGHDYSQFRNDGLKYAHQPWILYVDADERVTPQLREEMAKILTYPQPQVGAFAIPRRNIYLGKHLRFGGWGNDYVIRLFRRSHLQHWHYPLHEQPVFSGQLAKLRAELVHFSHRDLSLMLNKTLEFTAFEARLRYDAHHPPIAWWRIVRVMGTEFWHRFIKLSAWRDGAAGIIDGLFQVFNTFVIYARLWELQHGQSLSR